MHLAKELASLDRLSNGRLIVGAGAGWLEAEFDALGVPFDERGPRTDEAIERDARVLGRPAGDFDGPHRPPGEHQGAAHAGAPDPDLGRWRLGARAAPRRASGATAGTARS